MSKSPLVVIRVNVMEQERGKRRWLLVSTDRVLNPSAGVLNLTPHSREQDMERIRFGLASGLFKAGLGVTQVNSGAGDPCITIVLEDEHMSIEACRKVAREVHALLEAAGCDVIVDSDRNNLLGQ